MNILILMAGGTDASFKEVGYLYPKNLVEIAGVPLVQRVIENLSPIRGTGSTRLVCCISEEEDRQVHTGSVIQLIAPGASIVRVHASTGGAVCTALLAIEAIKGDEPLVVANGDQVIRADVAEAVADFRRRQLDGGIVVFQAVHPRWSYVRTDAAGMVVEAAEKRPISNQATAGLYYFARGADFVEAAMSLVRKDAHTNGQFYVCPVYNEMILRQKRIGTYAIARDAYFSLSHPQGIRALEDELRQEAAEARQSLRPQGRGSLRPASFRPGVSV